MGAFEYYMSKLNRNKTFMESIRSAILITTYDLLTILWRDIYIEKDSSSVNYVAQLKIVYV